MRHRVWALCWVVAAVSAPMGVRGQATAREIVLVEEWRLSGADQLLGHVGSVRTTAHNDALLQNGSENVLRVFDSTGKAKPSIGRTGQGPGDFQRIQAFGAFGDTIWAVDGSLHRITYFDARREVIRTVVGPPAANGTAQILGGAATVPAAWQDPYVMFPDGTMLVWPSNTLTPGDSIALLRLKPLLHLAPDGKILDTVVTAKLSLGMLTITAPRTAAPAATGRAADTRLVARGPSGSGPARTLFNDPFPPDEIVGMSVDGRRVAVSDVAYDGPQAGTYGVRLYDERGRNLYQKRFPFVQRPIGATARDSIAAAIAQEMTRTPNATDYVRKAIVFPPSYPPVESVMVDRDGSVWVKNPSVQGRAVWTVIDPQGTARGTVRLPAGVRLVTLDRGVWAAQADVDDVDSVIRYRLPRP